MGKKDEIAEAAEALQEADALVSTGKVDSATTSKIDTLLDKVEEVLEKTVGPANQNLLVSLGVRSFSIGGKNGDQNPRCT